MGFGSSLLKGIHFGERRTKVVETSIPPPPTYVYRDELVKKKPKIKKQVKFDLEPKYISQDQKDITLEKNTINDHQEAERSRVEEGVNNANCDGVLKVKIRMKKEDAARLLLKYRDGGGAIEFMDVAHQLELLPSTSVRVLSS